MVIYWASAVGKVLVVQMWSTERNRRVTLSTNSEQMETLPTSSQIHTSRSSPQFSLQPNDPRSEF